MRRLIENNSYLIPISRKDLYIDKIVYLEYHGIFLPRLISAFDRDKDTSIVLKNSHYVSVAYPLDRIYEVIYL